MKTNLKTIKETLEANQAARVAKLKEINAPASIIEMEGQPINFLGLEEHGAKLVAATEEFNSDYDPTMNYTVFHTSNCQSFIMLRVVTGHDGPIGIQTLGEGAIRVCDGTKGRTQLIEIY
jgi:hypothetical protein